MAKLTPPSEFDFSRPSDFPSWRARFQRFATASKLSAESGEVQVSMFLYTMGAEAETIFNTLSLSATQREDLGVVAQKFTEYFVPQSNVIHERAIFNQRAQKAGESVEAYVRSLHDLAQHCDFGSKKDEHIRDRLVVGLADRNVSRDLQMKSQLTLAHAVSVARQAETVKENMKCQMEPAAAAVTHEVEHRGRRQVATGKGAVRSGNIDPHSDSDMIKCKFCNRKHARNRKVCFARNAECDNCKQKGHFAVCCNSQRSVREVFVPEAEQDGPDNSYFLGAVNVNAPGKPWEVKLRIGGHQVKFKLDSGADVTVITEETYRSLRKQPVLTPTNVSLNSVGSQLKCLGTFMSNVSHKGTVYNLHIYVIEKAPVNLLSRTASQAMGFLKISLHETSTLSSVYGNIGLMSCKPVKIRLKPDAEPYSVNVARRVPLPLLDKVEQELSRMERDGVITRVTDPTEWCAPMVPVIKRNGSIRICVDLKQLNRAVVREKYVLPVLEDILPKLSGASVFSSLDAASGFWAIPLDPDCSKLTTFITPFGRFCFQRLPFGITSAPEIFQRIMHELLRDIQGVVVFMDDILVYGSSTEEHDSRLQMVLEKIKQSGLKLNKAKCNLRCSGLDFLGHHIDAKGIRPSTEKCMAIQNLQPPTCQTELRRCLGMFNYLGRFVPHLSQTLRPLNDLLSNDAQWNWDSAQDIAFNEVKQLITSAPILTYYDPGKPVIVSADASSYGLGAAIFQEIDGRRRPIAYASRTLINAERKYAQIEKECLAVVWSCEKFAHYLSGLPSFKVETDHKPLVPLIMTRDIDKVPLRCQRLLLRLMRFNPEAVYVPGKDLVVADALSRSPQPLVEANDEYLVDEVLFHVDSVVGDQPTFPVNQLATIRLATENDEELQEVINMTLRGWPTYFDDVPKHIQKYYELRGHLSVSEGLLLYNDRIYVPQSLRSSLLEKIHDGHQGVTKSRQHASTVFWMGMNDQIKDTVDSCKHCQQYKRRQQAEPLKPTVIPDLPWQTVATDLFEFNARQYLVIVDQFSRFLEFVQLAKTDAQTVIVRLKEIFARWGIPEKVMSDNGPQYASQEFANFARDYGFRHVTSSPYYPQSNGAAERAVQIAKTCLRQSDPMLALMIYRATPNSTTGVSPAQLLMGRQIRTTVPTIDRHLEPKWPDMAAVRLQDKTSKENHAYYYDRHHGAAKLPELVTGQQVLVRTGLDKSWSTPATVVEPADTPRSSIVMTDSGSIYRRNRRHLQLVPDTPPSVVEPPSPQGIPVGEPGGEKGINPNDHSFAPDPAYGTTKSGRAVKPVNRLNL